MTFEEILDFESHKPVNISIISDIIFVKIDAKDKSASFPRYGSISHKLHKNHEHLIQDQLSWILCIKYIIMMHYLIRPLAKNSSREVKL